MNIEDDDKQTKKEYIVYTQGDSYQEEDYDYEDGDEEEGSRTSPLDDKKKYIIIGGAIIVICIVISIIVKAIGGDGSKSKDIADTEQKIQQIESSLQEDSGAPIEGGDIEEAIITEDGADADTLKDANGNILGETVTYTLDEIQQLREAGYTASAIEDISKKGVAFADAIKQAKDERTRYVMKLYKELDPKAQQGSQSDEYKALLEQTWLGGDLRPVVKEANQMYTTKSIRENCRYTKVSPNGGELFIRLVLKNGDALYFNVHPSTYEQLDDEGNMVIDYDQVTYGEYIYYTNIKEVPISD